MSDIRFDRTDITLEPIPPALCDDCEEREASHYLQASLRALGMDVSLGDTKLCLGCGEQELEALRASLPEPLNEDGTFSKEAAV